MNMENVSYSMRSMGNPGREEAAQYDQGSMQMDVGAMNMNLSNVGNLDMGNLSMMGGGGANYKMNRAVLTNPNIPNEYGNDMDSCTADMISQMKMEQAMNGYNEQNGSMISQMKMEQAMNGYNDQNGSMMAQMKMEQAMNGYNEQNGSMMAQGMNLNMDPPGYESYRNLSNYNSTQNTIKAGHLPMHMNMDEYGAEQVYMNQNGMQMYSDEFLKNLPETENAMLHASNYQMQQGTYNPMGQNIYSNFQSPLSVYDNLPNQQIFMNPSAPCKQTRQVPLPSGSNTMHAALSGSLNPNMSQMMQPQMNGQGPTQHLAPNMSIRKNTTLAKRKMKAKKFFPCC